MRYFVVNLDTRKAMFGPYYLRSDADKMMYDLIRDGIPVPETGEVKRPRVAVIGEGGIVPNEHGNHFVHDTSTVKPSSPGRFVTEEGEVIVAASSGTVPEQFRSEPLLPAGGNTERPGNSETSTPPAPTKPLVGR